MDTHLLKKFALPGAKQRVEDIQRELTSLWNTFGSDLFPFGSPRLNRPAAVANGAKKLIEGAEKLAKKHKKAVGRPKWKFSADRRAAMWPPSAPDSERVFVSEAAQILKKDNSVIRFWMTNGTLKACPDTTDPRKRMQLYRADVMALLEQQTRRDLTDHGFNAASNGNGADAGQPEPAHSNSADGGGGQVPTDHSETPA